VSQAIPQDVAIPGQHFSLVGDEEPGPGPCLKEYVFPKGRPRDPLKSSIAPPRLIGMNEHPTKAPPRKSSNPPSPSALVLMAAGKWTPSSSAGTRGPCGWVQLLHPETHSKPIQRPLPILTVPFQRKRAKNCVIWLDVRLNADCKAENLNHFATLGSFVRQPIPRHSKNPRAYALPEHPVKKKERAHLLAQATYPFCLRRGPIINFCRQHRSRDIPARPGRMSRLARPVTGISPQLRFESLFEYHFAAINGKRIFRPLRLRILWRYAAAGCHKTRPHPIGHGNLPINSFSIL